MSRKKEIAAKAAEAALPRIPSEWLDQVITRLMSALSHPSRYSELHFKFELAVEE